jgi:5-formyltetrahydrofolate cyclo-ligase
MTGEPKRDLRLRILDERRARSAPDREALDAALAERTTRWLAQRPEAGSLTLAAYAPMLNEPGGPLLPLALVPYADRMLLPVWQPNNDLDWAIYEGELAPNPRRPAEPHGPRLGSHAIAEATVVLVPALAVDHTGMRLGRGGGSYDRALNRLAAGAVAVAMLYDDEILTEPVPADAHDRPVHGAITPGGLHWFHRPRL